MATNMDVLSTLAVLSNPQSDTAQAQAALPTQVSGWRELLQIGDRQHILPTIWKSLSNRGLTKEVSPEGATIMEASSHRAAALNSALMHTADKIMDAAREEKIQIIPIKGLHFIEKYYSIDEREMSDADFLVRVGDAERLLPFMKNLGLLPDNGQFSERFLLRYGSELKFRAPASAVNLLVECRWSLPHSAPMKNVFPIPEEDFWRRAVTDDAGAMTLCPEDHLILVAFHLAILHSFSRLLWLSDMHRIIRSETIDWDAIASRALKYRIAGAVYYALKYTREFFGTEIPEGPLRRLKPRIETVTRSMVSRCMQGEKHIPEMGVVRVLVPDDILGYLRAAFFPGLDYVAMRDGTSRAGAFRRIAGHPARFAAWFVSGKK